MIWCMHWAAWSVMTHLAKHKFEAQSYRAARAPAISKPTSSLLPALMVAIFCTSHSTSH